MADDSIKSSKASDEVKDEGHVATEWEVDVAAQLSAGFDEDISDADALRIRKKIDWHLMPLMCGECRDHTTSCSARLTSYTCQCCTCK